VLDRAFDNPLQTEERASMPLAGGIMQHGYQCGMIWGAALAAGAEAHRRFGRGPKTEAAAIIASSRAVAAFRTRHDTIDCFEITDIDKDSSGWKQFKHFLLKLGVIGCFRMASWYGPLALDAIESTLAEEIEAPDAPVSCAAMVVQKMGGNDLHQSMAAGMAGGIGLCGGACGALGAVIWMRGVRKGEQEGKQKLDFKAPDNLELIERFLKQTDYEFECSKIVGKTFAHVRDHAKHLGEGGCAALIEALAADPAED
jgi:hypothetical protein